MVSNRRIYCYSCPNVDVHEKHREVFKRKIMKKTASNFQTQSSVSDLVGKQDTWQEGLTSESHCLDDWPGGRLWICD